MLFSGACGGGGSKGISLVTSPSLTPEHSPNVSVLGASGLKPEIHFTYSLDSHPSTGGFTVVALENEYTPKQPADAPYAISVQPGEAAEPKVALSATGQRIVLAHFRYDPTKWEVGGVYISNSAYSCLHHAGRSGQAYSLHTSYKLISITTRL